ncbi:MAG: VWA domain-containing protein [Verrucomicrobiota bacterium]
MNFTAPHFAEPRWLWLAVVGPLLLLALQGYAAWARQRQLARIAAPEFIADLTRSHSPFRRGLKSALLLLACAGIGIALARPQWGVREITTKNLSEDIVFAVDCSRSMLAADVSPHRLGRAKLAVQDFVRRHTNGRVGLVAFAGQAFLQCPLTFDHGAFEDALLALDEKTIVVPGTDVGSALDEAFRAMEKLDRKKVIVLITDGEDLEKGGVKKAKALAEKGVVVFTIGVGTEAGAEIRIMNEQGQMELVRDSKGEAVRSRLDEPTLRSIAEASRGNYYPLGALGEGLVKVRTAIETGSFESGAAPIRKQGVDRFHVPVACVLGLLVLESLVGTRRRVRANVVGVILVGFLVTQFGAKAEGINRTNVTPAAALKQEVPEQAPETAREFFNAGTGKLREGKLREAEGWLLNSLATQDEQVQPESLYNLGHVRYELGKEELKKSPDAAAAAQRGLSALERGDQALRQGRDALAGEDVQRMVQAYLNGRGARRELREATDQVRRAMEAHGAALLKWQRALGDFKSALELNPTDFDAKRNVELLEEAIAKLIDKIRALQQLGQIMGQQSRALGEMMKQLRGKMPAPDAPPGGSGDDEEEDDDKPNGPREGQQEGPSREGQQVIKISREEAGWILDAFKLGGDRRLPMGQGEEANRRIAKGRNW